MEKEEPIEMDGVVTELLGNANFRVLIDEKHEAIATMAGKMRRHRIRVLPNDRVKLELSPYDLTRGRIVYRYK